MADLLEEITAALAELPEGERDSLLKFAVDRTKGKKWTPTPGPQTAAYYSDADVLLYGGQAGGGKTDLLIGLAFNEHTRTLMMRRRSSDLSAMIDRSIEVNGTRKGYSGAPPKSLRLNPDENATSEYERKMEFRGCPYPGDEQATQGQPRDLLGLEEGAQLLESQVRYLMGWVRSARPGQRCRTVIASNPPLTDEGQWMFKMFQPWLDPAHPAPALPGELRWYVTDSAGEDEEVDGPGVYEIGLTQDGKPNLVRAMSRTFIPASLDDNPFLRETNYRASLDALPEPLRSAMRDGNFQAGRIDDPYQVIPTQWIIDAQNRWSESPPEAAPMTAMGVDVARGGTDKTVIASRYDWWFRPMVVIDGADTKLGTDVAAAVIKERRNAAAIVIDMGGGYGGAPYEHLKQNLEGSLDTPDRIVFGYNGANASHVRTVDRQMEFFNRRAETWWRFREALDPSQQGGSPIALPPDTELMADLVSARFRIVPRGIQIESKEDIIQRLGRSPDRGDAVVMAWSYGPSYLTHGKVWRDYATSKRGQPAVVHKYTDRKRRR
jgi:hypothetical protein